MEDNNTHPREEAGDRDLEGTDQVEVHQSICVFVLENGKD